jgi:hypothetical protein
MQHLHCENKGMVELSDYIPSLKTLFVLFKSETSSTQPQPQPQPQLNRRLVAFSFDPQNRRLTEIKYVSISFL